MTSIDHRLQTLEHEVRELRRLLDRRQRIYEAEPFMTLYPFYDYRKGTRIDLDELLKVLE